MTKTLIIDSEKNAEERIAGIIDGYCKGFIIEGSAKTLKQGMILIQKTQPDLVLLNVMLKDGSGFELLNKIEDRSFEIVFMADNRDFAYKAIKYNALDYILKPVDEKELIEALLKVAEKRKQENSKYLLRSFLSNFAGQKSNGKKVVLKTTDDIHIVEVSNIIRCESDGSYTKVHLADSSQIVVSKNLKEFEELLTDYGLLRVHHSHLVNINHIERFHKRSGGLIIMSDKSDIPVSVRKKENLIELFEKM
jgi:two-component system LytT family response regulator